MFKTFIIFCKFFKSLTLLTLWIHDFCDFTRYLVFLLYRFPPIITAGRALRRVNKKVLEFPDSLDILLKMRLSVIAEQGGQKTNYWEKVMRQKRYILFLILLGAIIVPDVYADGCFVWREGADLYEPSQKAIIYWNRGKEVLVLQVKYEGQAGDFAWIVPLPAQPEVTAVDAHKSPFAEISLYTQSRQEWGKLGRSSLSQEQVTVLERKVVGVYDITVLSASDARALSNWLNRNGYVFPAKSEYLLEHYTKKNWVYAAMRIDPGALENADIGKLKTGQLQPIRFAFKTAEMIYPLRISSINAGETELLLYLLSETPMEARIEKKRNGLSMEQNLIRHFGSYLIEHNLMDSQYGTYRKAGKDELPLTWEALGISDDVKLSLCKYRAIYTSEEMTEDIIFTPFEPVAYWGKKFSIEPWGRNYQKEQDREIAFTVLAWLNTRLLQQFARDKNSANRQLAALHPKTSEELLLELAKDNDFRVKRNLVSNRDLPLVVLEKLSKDENWHIRAGAARHRNSTLDILQRLVNDKSVNVRMVVMGHHAISARLLEVLSRDEDETIRGSVAYEEKTSIALLSKLAKDKSAHVRACAARQHRLPKELVEELAGDDSDEVRRSVAFWQNLPAETLLMLSNDANSGVRAAVAHNRNTSGKLLKKLANDIEKVVRSVVAENPNTPEDILAHLADDDEYWVRHCVAANPSTARKLLTKLAEDENLQVSQQATSSLTDRKAH